MLNWKIILLRNSQQNFYRPFVRPVNDLLLSFLEGKHFDVILVFKGHGAV